MLFGPTLFRSTSGALQYPAYNGTIDCSGRNARAPASQPLSQEGWSYVVPICNLLTPDYNIHFDANGWIQGDSLFDDSRHLSAEGSVPFQPRLGPLLRPASVGLSPQTTAHSQGSSSL